jgi:hypothetical protein
MKQIRQIKQIDTNGYRLEKTPNSCSYSLYIKGDYKEELFLSLPRIPNMFYDDQENKIIFAAESVTKLLPQESQTIQNTITYLQAINMIKSLSKQMNNLNIMSNLIFYGFDLDDILVINNDTFIIVSSNHLLKIDDERNNKIVFNCPFLLPYFSSPELIAVNTLPTEVDYRASYYSLGALITFCLTNKYLFIGNEVMRETDIEKVLQPIFCTKVYWFLKRCLTQKYEERQILFI